MAKNKQTESAVKKTVDNLTKDLPKLVSENKGAAIGAVLGYLLSDKLQENEGLVTAVLGGLVGHVADEKKKDTSF